MERARRRPANHDWWDKFWKDKHGDVVVYQHPNIWLIGWLVLTLISLFLTGTPADVLWYVALGLLTIWALLELLRGVNYLRRTVGAAVLLLIVIAVFKLA